MKRRTRIITPTLRQKAESSVIWTPQCQDCVHFDSGEDDYGASPSDVKGWCQAELSKPTGREIIVLKDHSCERFRL